MDSEVDVYATSFYRGKISTMKFIIDTFQYEAQSTIDTILVHHTYSVVTSKKFRHDYV